MTAAASRPSGRLMAVAAAAKTSELRDGLDRWHEQSAARALSPNSARKLSSP